MISCKKCNRLAHTHDGVCKSCYLKLFFDLNESQAHIEYRKDEITLIIQKLTDLERDDINGKKD